MWQSHFTFSPPCSTSPSAQNRKRPIKDTKISTGEGQCRKSTKSFCPSWDRKHWKQLLPFITLWHYGGSVPACPSVLQCDVQVLVSRWCVTITGRWKRRHDKTGCVLRLRTWLYHVHFNVFNAGTPTMIITLMAHWSLVARFFWNVFDILLLKTDLKFNRPALCLTLAKAGDFDPYVSDAPVTVFLADSN